MTTSNNCLRETLPLFLLQNNNNDDNQQLNGMTPALSALQNNHANDDK